MRTLAAVTLMAVLVGTAVAQEVAKPGAEHKMLGKREGTWETTLKSGDKSHKGVMKYRMEMGGLWLTGSLESDMDKGKYFGRSMDTYDAKKKKYIGYWFDSMSATPLKMEGTYDKESKIMTLTGDSVGMDGKPVKYKSVTKMPDDDTMEMGMYFGNAKEPMFTVSYKRKK